jgi:sigma-B regulation protein RsbU (phosphoserine phosphatase)
MVVRLKEKIAALARETAAREGIESELRIARQIQQDLLPRPTPAFVGRTDFDLHAVNVPARRVAGDFYDYFFVGDKLLIVIADVSGKGMPAALLMAVARTVVRDFASLNLSPAQIVAHANQTIFDGSDDSMFVTMFLAQYQPTTGGLTYVCAGHPPPYILSPSRSPSHLGRPTAPLLGVFDGCEVDLTIRQEERTLQPGETLFLYTDGVTDARSPGGRMVNEEGLVRAFARLGTFDARSLCERVLAGLQAHEQGGQADDITMLALRRTNGDNSAGDPAPAGSDGAPPI